MAFGWTPFEWTQSLSTGVEEIDNQHKELFIRFNDFLTAVEKGKGKEEVGKILEFLDDYVVFHFLAEERYMTKYNYPDYSSHKSQHKQFIEDFAIFKNQFAKGTSLELVIQVNQRLCAWLVNHVSKIDKAMGSFLKTKLPIVYPKE